jgi:hypothetical protein
MPYFIDRDSRTVIVKSPGKNPMPCEAVVDGETAMACNLTHGQVLTSQEVGFLLEGSIAAFNASIAGGAGHRDAPTRPVAAPPAPLRLSGSARAHGVARVVETASWIFLIISAIFGIAVAAQTEYTGVGETTHPHIAEGIAIAIVGSFQALVVIMFASYIAYRTQEPPTAPS